MSDGYQQPSDQVLGWVEAALGPGSRVVVTSRLVGGLTADMDRLTVVSGSRSYDVVLRRWGNSEWAKGLIDREAAGLTLLVDRGLPTPRLLATDRSGDQAGTPCLLMTALPGAPLLRPPDMDNCLRQMAKTLVAIHDVAPDGLADTDPHAVEEDAEHAWIGDPALRRAVTDAASDPARSPHVLVHGDYHLFNILWCDERLSGVVDWTYTGHGPPEIDVGHCRLALAVVFSSEAAETLLHHYEAEAGRRVDPRGDIRALLNFDLGWLEFVPRLVAGRAPLDLRGMPSRVEAVLRAAVSRLR